MSETGADSARPRRVQVGLLVVIAMILTGWALRATYPVTMPLTLAFFLAILMYPVQRAIRLRTPRRLQWLGPAAALLLMLAVLIAGLALIGWGVTKAAAEAPKYEHKLQEDWAGLVEWAGEHNIPLAGDILNIEMIRGQVVGYLTTGFTAFWWWIALLVVIFFLVLLMLLEAHDWREKLQAAFCCGRGDAAHDTVDHIAAKIRRYLLVRTAMSALNGGTGAAWLWLVGVDFWYLWGVMIFVLNYIPNLGSIIAIIPPAIMAFLQLGWGWAILAVGGLTLMDQFIGNYLDPRLQGRALDISPVIVLVTILLWAWIWGVVGMLLATPITISIILVCEQIESLKPVAQLLRRTAHHDEAPR